MLLSRVVRILGGRKVLRRSISTRLDMVALGSHGISKLALLRLADYLGLSVSEMACLLPVTERSIQRYAPSKHFNRMVSEHILQIAEVAARGTEVFGDRELFLSWLNHQSPALAHCTPHSLLASRFGAELVLDELGRMEHGVVS